MQSLISVVIPCYNASLYITETLTSVLLQQGVNVEIITINDGSTDHTESLIQSKMHPNIIYVKQANKGVSAARNLGLKKAKGEYIVFFDADDIMPANFLFSRLEFLVKNNTYDFVSGRVQKFNTKKLIAGNYRGTCINVFEEILYYNTDVITCPSNYMFKSSFLIENSVAFNEILSSTADRFFILQCAKVGHSRYDKNLVPLHYRVSENSMSHLLTSKLVLDNDLYYNELLKNNLIPLAIKNKSIFLGNYILSMSYLKTGNIYKATYFVLLCIIKNPVLLFKKIICE